MLETLLRMYTLSMAYDVRSPMPHLAGPPGCGKTTYVEQLADLLGVNLHIINVSRLSPLEIEGVQMPHGTDEDMGLRMLPATFWTSLREGDILLMDEFLRGFPEVYNALLDIFTSRRAGAYRLPKVFIIGASNTVVAYDQALEDRLLHLPVPDPRSSSAERGRISQVFVDVLGLEPAIVSSYEMADLISEEILPMYKILDSFKASGNTGTHHNGSGSHQGSSLRQLLGQVQLRHIKSAALKELILTNNRLAISNNHIQNAIYLDSSSPGLPDYVVKATAIQDSDKLSPVQRRNIKMNLQLAALDAAATYKETDEHDHD